MLVEVFSDASIKKERSGWASLVRIGDRTEKVVYGRLPERKSTAFAELFASVEGIKIVEEPSDVVVWTDHLGNVSTARKQYLRETRKQGLWAELRELARFHESLEFRHVRGHGSHAENRFVDHLSRMAAKKKRGILVGGEHRAVLSVADFLDRLSVPEKRHQQQVAVHDQCATRVGCYDFLQGRDLTGGWGEVDFWPEMPYAPAHGSEHGDE